MTPDACANAEPLSRLEQLERENADFRTWGIIEIAIRNPNVAEYMAHWEARAEKAEAALAALDAETEVKVRELVRELVWETGKRDYRYKGAIYNGIEAEIFTGGRYIIDLIQHDPDAPIRGGVKSVPFEPYISLQCSSWAIEKDFRAQSGKFETLEAAKAAAQADYERRIRSALVPPEARS